MTIDVRTRNEDEIRTPTFDEVFGVVVPDLGSGGFDRGCAFADDDHDEIRDVLKQAGFLRLRDLTSAEPTTAPTKARDVGSRD